MVEKVESVEKGAVAAVVKISVVDPFTMTATITAESVEDLGLKKGGTVSVIEVAEVMLAKG